MRLQIFAAGPKMHTLIFGSFASTDEVFQHLAELDTAYTAAEIFDLDDAPWNPPILMCYRDAGVWYSIRLERKPAPL